MFYCLVYTVVLNIKLKKQFDIPAPTHLTQSYFRTFIEIPYIRLTKLRWPLSKIEYNEQRTHWWICDVFKRIAYLSKNVWKGTIYCRFFLNMQVGQSFRNMLAIQSFKNMHAMQSFIHMLGMRIFQNKVHVHTRITALKTGTISLRF